MNKDRQALPVNRGRKGHRDPLGGMALPVHRDRKGHRGQPGGMARPVHRGPRDRLGQVFRRVEQQGRCSLKRVIPIMKLNGPTPGVGEEQ